MGAICLGGVCDVIIYDSVKKRSNYVRGQTYYRTASFFFVCCLVTIKSSTPKRAQTDTSIVCALYFA